MVRKMKIGAFYMIQKVGDYGCLFVSVQQFPDTAIISLSRNYFPIGKFHNGGQSNDSGGE